MNTRPNVLIGTPTFDRTFHAEYLLSMLTLLSAGVGASFGIRLPYSSLLPMARNVLATAVLENPSYTHLLFVDSDMGFQPSLVRRMLAFDKPFVGCTYPRRWVDRDRLTSIAQSRADLQSASIWNAAMGYVGTTTGPVEGGFARASFVGTGILLVHRSALEQMRAAFPDLWAPQSTDYLRSTLGPHTGLFQPFTPMTGPDGIYTGEDVAFVRRWVEGCNGEMWACVDETITHSGGTTYSGNFAERLGVGEE